MSNFIHKTAIVGPNVTLGDNVYIGPYCVIGEPAEHKLFWNAPIGEVVIGDNCVITGHVTIDAGTIDKTIIGAGTWMLKHSHVGHDCVIGNNVTISCGAKIGGHSTIMQNSNIGLNAVLHQFSVIQEGCMIGASAFFKGESEPFTKYAGVPARKLGVNKPR
jgi:UDP-N-acetylglucosamine acyltransferase